MAMEVLRFCMEGIGRGLPFHAEVLPTICDDQCVMEASSKNLRKTVSLNEPMLI
jgi:hypothetical protein